MRAAGAERSRAGRDRVVLSGLSLAAALALGCQGPLGPIPGTGFAGRVERAAPAEGWAHAHAVDSVDVQIGSDSTRTVRTGFVVDAGRPHLPVTWAPLKRWPDVVRRHPRVRVRIEGRIFAFDAHEVTDAEQLARLRQAGQAKYGPPFHARSLNDSTYYFRLDPPKPASGPFGAQ